MGENGDVEEISHMASLPPSPNGTLPLAADTGTFMAPSALTSESLRLRKKKKKNTRKVQGIQMQTAKK